MNAAVKEPKVSFAEAFLALQASIKPAIKCMENGAFKGSKYADLSAVWDAVKAPLHDNGFGIIQAPQFEGETMFLETTLLHAASGDKMVSRYPLKPAKQDPQGFGSAITYARRYSISALLGVIADDDDDGNAASGANGSTKQIVTGKITPDQAKTIRELIERTQANIEGFCAHFKIEAVPDLPANKYSTAVEMLNMKAGAK